MIRLELKMLGERIAVEAPQPPERVRLDEVLPILREIDNRAIDIAVSRVEAEGKSVSCRKGCSFCCRSQPVPIAPVEAFALLRLVEALPEPRRIQVKERFAANVEQLRGAGLIEIYRHEQPLNSKEEARAVAQRYFHLGLVCPFLEDDACGIYADRPFVCRQYLVTSPAELCADPFSNPVQPIAVPLRLATAMLQVTEKHLGTPQRSLPLALALDYAETHRSEGERTFLARDVFGDSFEAMTAR